MPAGPVLFLHFCLPVWQPGTACSVKVWILETWLSHGTACLRCGLFCRPPCHPGFLVTIPATGTRGRPGNSPEVGRAWPWNSPDLALGLGGADALGLKEKTMVPPNLRSSQNVITRSVLITIVVSWGFYPIIRAIIKRIRCMQ